MARLIRLGLLTVFALAINTPTAHAAAFSVAEFRWDVLTDPGLECTAGDVDCVPADPFTQSILSLTNLWDGAGDLVLFDNTLTVPDQSWTLNDLGLFDSDQQLVLGIPASAAIHVSFTFDGQIVSLSPAPLLAPGSTLLTFDPTSVPEPGTFGLLVIGLGVLARRARRA